MLAAKIDEGKLPALDQLCGIRKTSGIFAHIKQIHHGKFARISRTSLLLKTGASEPALRLGSPVVESVTILIFRGRLLCGIKMIRPASIFASSGSPGRMPNFRRNGPGRTTWPLVETLVVTVRQSYVYKVGLCNACLGQELSITALPVS